MALDGPNPDAGPSVDLIAASLRADSGELDSFVEVLAAKLEEAIPKGVRIDRWRERVFGPKRVRQIRVDAGDQRLELRYTTSGVTTRRSTVSGGIVLRSEEIDTDTWVSELSAALAREAERNQQTREALERLLTG